MSTPERTIGRISQYRRLVREMKKQGRQGVYSHDLAEMIGGTAAQVRRDLMLLGFAGSSRTGYAVDGLLLRISEFLDAPQGENIALFGVGNLGRALMPFFRSHHQNLRIVASFDTDPLKAGRVIHGCRCYGMEEMEAVIVRERVKVAILAIPAGSAQGVVDRLVATGIRGILNFVPVSLQVPAKVAVENIDMGVALEKVAFLARSIEKDLIGRRGSKT